MDNAKLAVAGNVLQEMTCNINFVVQNDFTVHTQTSVPCSDPERATVTLNVNVDSAQLKLAEMNKGKERNPYQNMPVRFIFDELDFNCIQYQINDYIAMFGL